MLQFTNRIATIEYIQLILDMIIILKPIKGIIIMQSHSRMPSSLKCLHLNDYDGT